MSHAAIQKEYYESMNVLAETLDKIFNRDLEKPRKTGFVLLVFPFGGGLEGTGRVNYISNADRAEMLVAMKEFIARAEGRYQEAPEAKQ